MYFNKTNLERNKNPFLNYFLMKNILNINQLTENNLKDKIIVITGAGSGLGKAFALGLAFAGAKVGILDINEEAVKATVNEINSLGGNAIEMVASVTDTKQLENVYSKLDSLYGLINCAGIARLGPINELDEKSIKLANDININGYYLNANIASKKMIENKNGCIINIASASARGVSEASSLYSVAKESQCMMTRAWALDLGKHNIRVNSILPGDLFGNEDAGIISAIWNKNYFEKKAIDKKLIQPDDPRLGEEKLNPKIRQLVIDHYVGRTALKKEVSYKDLVELAIFLFKEDLKITGESISLTSGNPMAFSR